MNYKIAKAVGLNTDQQAAQISISSGDPNNIFLSLLELHCDDAFTKGRQLLSDLVDYYLEGSLDQGSPGERLKKVFVKALEDLQEVQEFSIITAVVSGKGFYLIGKGEVGCFIRRLDKISPLDISSSQLVSGFLQEGDRVFLATKNLVDFLGEDLKTTLELSADQWEEEMQSRVALSELSQIPEGEETSDHSPAGRAGLIIDVAGDEESEGFKSVYDEQEKEEGNKENAGIKSKLVLILSNLSFLRRVKSVFLGNGKLKLISALALVLIIGLGVGLKYKNFKDQEKTNQFNQLLQVAKDDFSKAKSLQTLSLQDTNVKLTSAKDNLQKALNLLPQNTEALELKKQIEESEGGTLQKYDNISFTEYLDLDLVKNKFRANGMSLSVGKLLLLNPDDSTLVLIDLSKKSQKILSGKDKLGQAQVASVNGEFAFVYSKDKGIIKVDINNEKASASAKLDKDWGEIADLMGFAGNIYLLDKVSNQIWKYLSIIGGYSDKRKYLADGVKADFGSALKMQIESSVYVLKTGGEILRFTRGAPDNFSIGGLDKGIKDPKSFFVSSDTENLYILDSGNSRLVVLSKIGEYKGQYSGDKFSSSTDLVVDEKGKKVYLLEGSKIFQMDLK